VEIVEQPALFDEPPHHVPHPVARVVLLCGPSGSGKTSLTRRLGLPVLPLDDFYREGDDPTLPRRFGIVDWDDPASWDAEAALLAVLALCATGEADVPVYDIPTSRRTGTTRVDLAGMPVVLAEGIFAAELVAATRAAGVLADAICLRPSPRVTFWRRLLRDLSESRKPPLTLVRRGLALMREEPAQVARWTALGCRPLDVAAAEAAIRALVPQRDHAVPPPPRRVEGGGIP
jgi:uridine kinase